MISHRKFSFKFIVGPASAILFFNERFVDALGLGEGENRAGGARAEEGVPSIGSGRTCETAALVEEGRRVDPIEGVSRGEHRLTAHVVS